MTIHAKRQWWNANRFDAIELLLILGLTILGTSAASVALFVHSLPEPPPSSAVLRELRDKYGPGHSSRNAEEWIIRDYFDDKKHGVFLDVGANHFQTENNTYFLEKFLGWTGIAVEPLQQFEQGYKDHRPGTKFRAFFASDVSNERANLFFHENYTLVSSSNKDFTVRKGGDRPKQLAATTISLTDLLTLEGVQRLDFMSMDIELAEPQALAGFDIRRFRPELVCIEAHLEVRQTILDYFAGNDYVLVGRYLGIDPLNYYFMPRVRR